MVRFIGACTSRPNLCIVCELMPGGSVSDLLRRVRTRVIVFELMPGGSVCDLQRKVRQGVMPACGWRGSVRCWEK